MTTTTHAPVPGVSRAQLWTGRIISALPVLALLLSAGMKFSGSQAVIDGFIKFGYPKRLLVVLGIVELTCAIIYLIPRTAVLGAILVTGYLGGATATHVRVLDPSFVTPVLLGMLAWLGLYLRDRRMRELVPLRH